jgi:hypothetical protein
MFFRRRAAVCGASRLITTKRRNHGVLQSALNTQVITDTIVPLPIVQAQEFLKTANNKFSTGLFAKIKESIADLLKSTQSGPPTKR